MKPTLIVSAATATSAPAATHDANTSAARVLPNQVPVRSAMNDLLRVSSACDPDHARAPRSRTRRARRSGESGSSVMATPSGASASATALAMAAPALREPARDLAVDDHRIDRAADVVGHDVLAHRHAAGRRIDLDAGHVRPV